MKRPTPTSQERHFQEDELIVSKTDLKGRLTYVNDVFCSVGLYTEAEVLGQPHSILRHPDMPRAVFALLWQRIQDGREVFAFVKNLAKNGDFYWVLAHVTPSFTLAGEVDGYHSNRRKPHRSALAVIEPVYCELLRIEAASQDRRVGLRDSLARLDALLAENRQGYDEFVLGLATR